MSTPPPMPEGTPLTLDAEHRESLVEYPSRFPIKVVGVNEDGYVTAVTHVAKRFDPGFDAATIELRESGGGKYLGVTITVLATSRQQLDDLYRALTALPQVKWVL
ncbi:MAG: DUF493 domain-containing protein [Pseudomonadota bacterium]|nr:DUF493 domain-containing protein [Pseudomonadota bacterium]